jgi:hypothetical protein
MPDADLDQEFQDLLDNSESPLDVWNSRLGRITRQAAMRDWLAGVKLWKLFLTLTFKNPIAPDPAFQIWRRLVRILNDRSFGSHYTRLVHHSYFSYVLGIEFQRRDVVHFHALVDKPLNFDLVHRWWNRAAGFVWIDQIEHREKAIYYVTKYVTKGGELKIYAARTERAPKPLPLWWN